MTLYFLELTSGKDKFILNANNIETIYPKKRGKGSIITLNSSEESVDADESFQQITEALFKMDMINKASNFDMLPYEPNLNAIRVVQRREQEEDAIGNLQDDSSKLTEPEVIRGDTD